MFESLSTAFLGFETDVETTVRLAREFGFQSVDLSGQQTAGISKADSGSEVRRMLEGNGTMYGLNRWAGFFNRMEFASGSSISRRLLDGRVSHFRLSSIWPVRSLYVPRLEAPTLAFF